jgi:PAS domain S-box-containing protein
MTAATETASRKTARESSTRGSRELAAVPIAPSGRHDGAPSNPEETRAWDEAQYRDLFERAVEGIFRSTASGRALSINLAGARMLGYDSPEAMLLAAIGDAGTPWIDPERRAELVERVRSAGAVSDFEYEVHRHDGSTAWLSIHAHAVWDPDVPELCIEGLIVDVTRRREAEQALRESRERYSALFGRMAEGVTSCRMLFDEDGQPIDWIYLDVNPAFEELTGLADVIDKRATDVIPAVRETNPELFEIYGRVTKTGIPEHLETYLPALGRWFAISAFRPQAEHFAAVFENITGPRRVAEELRESGQQYRALVDHLAEGVVVQDAAGQITASNPAAQTILGLTIDPSTGRTSFDPQWQAVWVNGTPVRDEEHPATLARTTGQPVTGMVMGLRHSTGATRWLLVNAQPLRDASGDQLTGAVVSFADVTERERLARERERLSSIVEESPDGIVIAAYPDMRITYANAAFAEDLGWTQSELVGLSVLEVVDGALDAPTISKLLEVARSGQPWLGEVGRHLPDGTVGRVQIRVAPRRAADGTLQDYVVVTRDVSELRSAQSARVRLATAVEQAADFIIVNNGDGLVDAVNPAFEVLTGHTPADALGRSVAGLLRSGVDPPEVYAAIDAAIATGHTWMGRVTERRADGTLVDIDLSISPIRDAAGDLIGTVEIGRDRTHEREMDAEHDREMQIRAVLAESLGNIPPDATLEQAAQTICSELATLPFVDVAEIEVFLGDADVQVIGVAAPSGYPTNVGDHLPPTIAALIQERVAKGPWTGYAAEDAADEGWVARRAAAGLRALAYGPIVYGGHPVGTLLIGTFDAGFARTLVEQMPGVVSFSTTSSAVLAERMHTRRREAELRGTLHAVLASRSFHPVFQPIVDLASGETVGYEALTRFDTGQRPDLCFADAWSVGLGPDLEFATLAAAMAAAKGLPPGLWLDLNASPRLLADPDRLSALLGLAKRPVVLEVTEHEVVEDYRAVREAIRALGQDIRLAVDDAGAGIANFGHIIELRPDFVKLDISLVQHVNTNVGRQAMVVGMRHFSRTAGCRLIAEGIETEDESRTLMSLGVEYGQGYLLGRPEPAEIWAAEGSASGPGRHPTVSAAPKGVPWRIGGPQTTSLESVVRPSSEALKLPDLVRALPVDDESARVPLVRGPVSRASHHRAPLPRPTLAGRGQGDPRDGGD